MYSDTHISSGTRENRRRTRHDHGPDLPLPPVWRLAGEDEENDSDIPHIVRGID
jgi:hypothetical protein